MPGPRGSLGRACKGEQSIRREPITTLARLRGPRRGLARSRTSVVMAGSRAALRPCLVAISVTWRHVSEPEASVYRWLLTTPRSTSERLATHTWIRESVFVAPCHVCAKWNEGRGGHLDCPRPPGSSDNLMAVMSLSANGVCPSELICSHDQEGASVKGKPRIDIFTPGVLLCKDSAASTRSKAPLF